MGQWKDKATLLNKTFSFWEFCDVFNYSEFETKAARNVLKSFAKRGYIKRVSRNNYEKLE